MRDTVVPSDEAEDLNVPEASRSGRSCSVANYPGRSVRILAHVPSEIESLGLHRFADQIELM